MTSTLVSTAPAESGTILPFTHPLTREYQPGYLEPGSLHPDAILPCEMCGRDVVEGAIIMKFPKGSGFRGQLWHGGCFRLADMAVEQATA